VTPGLQGLYLKRVGVTGAEGTRSTSSAGNRSGPSPASAYHRSSHNCVPSCPLLRPPGAEIYARRLIGGHLVDERTRREVHQSGRISRESAGPGPGGR
jgi:hypothetical protein